MQKDVVARIKKWNPAKEQNLVLNKIMELDAPLLTTNFDDLIPTSMELDFRKISDTKFTDYYPWSCYYSNRKLANPIDGFGVWYINGMAKYHRSIKLGLSQYMGNVGRARRMIHKSPENISFEGKNKKFWPGHKTWLQIIFNKTLFVALVWMKQKYLFDGYLSKEQNTIKNLRKENIRVGT